MIKLLLDYNDHKAGQLVDLGCVRNKNLVDRGIAVWIKVHDVKYQVK